MRVCAIERDGCATLDSEGIWGMECGEKKKKYVADVTRARGSARLGSARRSLDWKFSKRFSGIRFRGRGGEGERVCVTLLADTGGFERKAHKYA